MNMNVGNFTGWFSLVCSFLIAVLLFPSFLSLIWFLLGCLWSGFYLQNFVSKLNKRKKATK